MFLLEVLPSLYFTHRSIYHSASTSPPTNDFQPTLLASFFYLPGMARVMALLVGILSGCQGQQCLILLSLSPEIKNWLFLAICAQRPFILLVNTLQCCPWRDKLDKLHLERIGERQVNAGCFSDLIMCLSTLFFAHVSHIQIEEMIAKTGNVKYQGKCDILL